MSKLGEFEPLTRSDWDFGRVPDQQLIACCLWEYARESTSLAFASLRHRVTMRQVTGNKTWGGLPDDEAAFSQHVKKMKEEEQRAGFDYEAFLGRFWKCDEGYVQFYNTLREYGGTSSIPWRKLAADTREVFCKQLNQRSVFEPCALGHIRELELLWQANSHDLSEVRARVRPANDDSEDMVLFTPSVAVALPEENADLPSRCTIGAFTIDYSRFSDREIINALTRWVRANRPKQWRLPRNRFPVVNRGSKLNDYRVALERLAIMRLLHWYSPRLLRLELPQAWKLYGRKEPTFRREIHAALTFYRERFPFLPKAELPASYERYSTWLRPILRSLDGDSKCTTIK